MEIYWTYNWQFPNINRSTVFLFYFIFLWDCACANSQYRAVSLFPRNLGTRLIVVSEHFSHYILASFPGLLYSSWLLAAYKNGGGRPGLFYHVNDVSVYLGRQRRGGVPHWKKAFHTCVFHFELYVLGSKTGQWEGLNEANKMLHFVWVFFVWKELLL